MRFLSATYEQRLELATDNTNSRLLQSYFGEDAIAEYRQLAKSLDADHLSGTQPANMLFLPGVMGSSLASTGLGGIWWLDVTSRHHINDLRLAADGVSDVDPRARIEPVSIMGAYEGFFAGTYDSGDMHHLALPYDWRKPLRTSAKRVLDTIVAASTARGGPVHIVAHSMGGLLARTALMTYPQLWDHVGRVVLIGTPHYGSPAIAGYLKNHLWGFELLALLGKYLDRAAFQSLRGVLSLLPAPTGVYPGTEGGSSHPCANFDLYEADAWRLSLTGTDRDHLQAGLDESRELHGDLHRWHAQLPQCMRDRMAAIVGVGYRTLFRLAYHNGFGSHWRHMDRVTRREADNPHREGDGRVPVASAVLPNLTEVRYVHAEHGQLASIPGVYTDAFRFLRGQPMQLPRSPAEALDTDHLGDDGDTSTPVLASFGPQPVGDDPGYLQMDDVAGSTLEALDRTLAAGGLPAFTRARLL